MPDNPSIAPTKLSLSHFKTAMVNERFLLFKLYAHLTNAPLAWLFYQYGVSANQVTAAGIMLALPAAALNAAGYYYSAIAVFHVFYMLDCVDGVLARATKTTSELGAYLDDLAHYVVHSVYFASLGLGLALSGRGVAGAIAVIAGLANSANRAHRELVKNRGVVTPGRPAAAREAPVFRAREFILRSFDFPNVLVALTAVAWQPSLLEGYLSYCALMNFLYLLYRSGRHAFQLRCLAAKSISNTPLCGPLA